MPIVDVEVVCASEIHVGTVSARAIADAVGQALGTAPGHTWVRLRFLSGHRYAENQVDVGEKDLPVFVTVLHARPPVLAALAAEVSALTIAVATSVGCSPEQVHVEYAPAGAGRQAFGGRLIE